MSPTRGPCKLCLTSMCCRSLRTNFRRTKFSAKLRTYCSFNTSNAEKPTPYIHLQVCRPLYVKYNVHFSLFLGRDLGWMRNVIAKILRECTQQECVSNKRIPSASRNTFACYVTETSLATRVSFLQRGRKLQI